MKGAIKEPKVPFSLIGIRYMAKKLINNGISVEALTHEEARRKNIPTAEFQSVMDKDEQGQMITV